MLAPLLLLLVPCAVIAQDSAAVRTKRVVARSVEGRAPRIDGRLDDDAWRDATFVDDFTQKSPDEGAAPHERTELAVVFDHEALYIGARMHRSDPSRIHREVTRRDAVGNTERIAVALDTYRDRRTAYTFVVTAAGARADYYNPSDEEYDRDYSYDPVWEARASIDSAGWTAELRIPFSQLRFNDLDAQHWGVNVDRWIPDLDEDIYWRMIPKDDNGWASRFGDLDGIDGIRPSMRLELLPYVAGQLAVDRQSDPQDPFDHATEERAGLDLKMGLGPNLTLDATVNPDFGQVEADPAQVNLSAYESFFDERRPFFVEGADLLEGSGARYFYSRRIGAPPHAGAEGTYVDAPRSSTILSAAKLTGRLASGTSVAALVALTDREEARTFDASDGSFRTVEVEPLVAYGVARVHQEIGGNQSTVGAIATITHRDFDDRATLPDLLPGDALTGGVDWQLRIDDGAWSVDGHAGGSYVSGTAASMLRLQLASSRYYQRPDAGYVHVDSSLTALGGYTTSMRISKNSGTWRGFAGASAESPGLELNDLGQLGTADDLDAYAGVTCAMNEPGAVLRDYRITFEANTGWNYGGVTTYRSFDLNANATLPSFWSFYVWGGYDLPAQSDNLSRGGPLMGTASGGYGGFSVTTPGTSSLRGWLNVNGSRNAIGAWDYGIDPGASVDIGEQWSLSLDAHFSRSMTPRQYVATVDGGGERTYGRRYVFARIDQTYLSAQLRLGYVIMPGLSVDLYAEPFAGAGRYYDFGELPEPRTTAIRRYAASGGAVERAMPGVVTIHDGAETFEVGSEDFTYLSFRSNLVLRWEWLRGSTAYLVIQRDAGDYAPAWERIGAGHLGDALVSPGEQTIALKIVYWLPVD
jgi:hypothetical protein